ncbi:hypothetical protein [Methanosarcina barkeri]|nr:hypothetical protein [Methanosarcina barkeri]
MTENSSNDIVGVIKRRSGYYRAATLPKSTSEAEISSQLSGNSRFSVLPK